MSYFAYRRYQGGSDETRLSNYLDEINRAEAQSSKRNRDFLSEISKVSEQASLLSEKTERLKEIRGSYEDYIGRVYPSWKKYIDDDLRKSKHRPVKQKNNAKIRDHSYPNASKERRRHTYEGAPTPSQETEMLNSSYPDFIQKNINGWKYDSSLNLPDHYSMSPPRMSPSSSSPNRTARSEILEEHLARSQNHLRRLSNENESNIKFRREEYLLKPPRPLGSNYVDASHSGKHHASFGARSNTFSPEYHDFNNNQKGYLYSPQSNTNTFLPVAHEFAKPSSNYSPTGYFHTPNSRFDEPRSSKHDVTASTIDINSIKILPQLLGISPDGQLVLLPMTTTLNATMNALQASSPLPEHSLAASRASPVGENSLTQDMQNKINTSNVEADSNSPDLSGEMLNPSLPREITSHPSSTKQKVIEHTGKHKNHTTSRNKPATENSASDALRSRHSNQASLEYIPGSKSNHPTRRNSTDRLKDEQNDRPVGTISKPSLSKNSTQLNPAKVNNVGYQDIKLSEDERSEFRYSLDAGIKDDTEVEKDIISNKTNISKKYGNSEIRSPLILNELHESSPLTNININRNMDGANMCDALLSKHDMSVIGELNENSCHSDEIKPDISPHHSHHSISKNETVFDVEKHEHVQHVKIEDRLDSSPDVDLQNKYDVMNNEPNLSELSNKKVTNKSNESVFSDFSDDASGFELPSKADESSPQAENIIVTSYAKMKTAISNQAYYRTDVIIDSNLQNKIDVNEPLTSKADSNLRNNHFMQDDEPDSVYEEVGKYAADGNHDVGSNDVTGGNHDVGSTDITGGTDDVGSNVVTGSNDGVGGSNTFDESVLFYLNEKLMERVQDDQSEEVLVLNLETDVNIVNTIIGTAEIEGDLSRFDASQICMAYRYHLEQSMRQRSETPFIVGELDPGLDFEGHLRDCVHPCYLEIWDSLFAFLSSIMDVFEFNPLQVAAIYAYALIPEDRRLTKKLQLSLATILAATASVTGSELSRDENDALGEEASVEDSYAMENKINKHNIGETTHLDVMDGKHGNVKTEQQEMFSASITEDFGDGEKSSKEMEKNENSLLQSVESNKLNGKGDGLSKSLSLDLGSVSEENDEEDSSTMSFDSDGLPIPKGKSKSAAAAKEKSEDNSLYSEDFEAANNKTLDTSSSAYQKMRKESLMSPIREDSDDLDDMLGDSFGPSFHGLGARLQQLESNPSTIKGGKKEVTRKKSLDDLSFLSSGSLPQPSQKGEKKSSKKVPDKDGVCITTDSKASSDKSENVELKKPGFWNHSDSESDVDLNNLNKSTTKPNHDDDFDFDFYD